MEKGYISGQPDILLLNRHTRSKGLCIELKNPNGKGSTSKNQIYYLKQMSDNGYQVLVSNDYDVVSHTIFKYVEGIRYKCDGCRRVFKICANREVHCKSDHKSRCCVICKVMSKTEEKHIKHISNCHQIIQVSNLWEGELEDRVVGGTPKEGAL